jgi:hypothetical protein
MKLWKGVSNFGDNRQFCNPADLYMRKLGAIRSAFKSSMDFAALRWQCIAFQK